MKLLINLKIGIVFLLCVFLFFGSITEYSYFLQKKEFQEDLFNSANESALKISSYLQQEISHNLSLSYGLTGYITSLNGRASKKEINAILEYIYSKGSHVKNVGLAPKNRIEYVYPIRGNEAVLGKNYEDIPDQWSEIQKAIKEKKTFISGPVNLIQGGRAFIYRIPVFFNNGSYYGIANVVMSLEELLEPRILNKFINLDHRLVIQAQDEVLYGNHPNNEDRISNVVIRNKLPKSNLEIIVYSGQVSEQNRIKLILIRFAGWSFNIVSCLLLAWILRENYKRRIIEKQLIRAKEKAEVASQAKTQFLTNMSHEIRTPLNAVMGFTQIMLDMERTYEDRDYLRKINDSSKYLLDILSDILDFSRIEANRLNLNPTASSLYELLKETDVILGYSARKKNISLESNIDSALGNQLFLFDSVRLRQILLNIIGNAIKFTDQGKVSFLCKLESVDREGKWNIYFSVKDTGVGMDESEKMGLFQNFSRGNDKKNKKYSGTGLGLAISKKLIELMGGYISFSSEPNRGSHFFFTIPFSIYRIREERKDKEDIKSLEEVELDKHKILLVEDNNLNQIVTKKLLNKLNQDVVVAENGAVAISILEEDDSIELVFMDISMPVMDGVEATKNIRLQERFKDLPIIALSAHVAQENKREYIQAGMNDHIPKPVDKEVLKETIHRYLSSKNKNDA